jgi:hypothetical protein
VGRIKDHHAIPDVSEGKGGKRAGNEALNLNILRKMALRRLRKMRMEKKRASAKRRMMHAALNSDFLYQALFSE